MRNLLNISSRTQLCAVIGNPLGHSLSPAIHNAAFAELGLDFIYLAFQVEQAASAVTCMRALEQFKGLSVTIPHKVAIMAEMDEIAEIDREIGAINTVIKEGGRLVGFGTDGPGAMKALADAGVDLPGKRVLMLGGGGAARAIAFTLARTAGIAELTLLEINPQVLDRLTADLRNGSAIEINGHLTKSDTLARAMHAADILVHCSPVGMHPKVEASLLPAELIRPEQTVFDIVYNPLKTKLIRDAEARGARTVKGADMFVNQAVLQFERFAGQAAPYETMRRVVYDSLNT